MKDAERLLRMAQEISRDLRPPIWRIRERRWWRRYQQPAQVLQRMERAVRDAELLSLAKYGISIEHSTEPRLTIEEAVRQLIDGTE